MKNYSKLDMMQVERERREFNSRYDEKPVEIKINQFAKGQKVNNPKYGIGTVKSQNGLMVTVKFEKEVKKMNANFLTLA
jgi:hypothetical protein